MSTNEKNYDTISDYRSRIDHVSIRHRAGTS
jgi:hypothetical protein